MTDQPTKKYEFVEGDTIRRQGRVLKRIRAIKDFSHVKKGDLGGYIEREENLSHEGNCWVGMSAFVHSRARIYEDARVTNYSVVGGSARVHGKAKVSEGASVGEEAEIYDGSCVSGYVFIGGYSNVSGTANINGFDHTGNEYELG